jgi:alpha-L-rhamnosidase
MKKNILFPSDIATTMLPLCRTLVRSLTHSAMKKYFVLLCVLCASVVQTNAQTWIWYPGDFEINLSNKVQNRRTERGTFFPVFWKMDNHYVLMDFHKVFDVPAQETVDIYVEGEYNVKLDGKAFEGSPKRITVPAGNTRSTSKYLTRRMCRLFM